MPALSLQDLGAIGLFAVVGNAMRNNVDFEKELGFYGSYHQEPHNQAIHFVFIPLIWWSICVWMCYLPVLGMTKLQVAGHPVTYGTCMLAIYCAYYCALDLFTGSIFSVILALMYLQASTVVQRELTRERSAEGKGKKKATGWSWARIAFVIHAVGWFMQIVPGHAIYEGVKPALFDSLGQAFGVAPLFAFLEGLWACGLAGDLHERVQVLVADNRAKMCASGGDFPWC